MSKPEALKRFYACFPSEKHKFQAQGGLIDGVSVLITMLQALGECKSSRFEHNVKEMPNILKRLLSEWDLLLCEILSLIEAITSLELDIRSIVRVCLNIYTIVRRGKAVFEPQGFDTLVMGTLLEAIPNPFKAILRNMSLLSNGKIMDDASMFSKLVSLIVDFLRNIVNKFDIFAAVREKILEILDYIPFGNKHSILSEIKNLLKIRKHDHGCLNDADIRDRIKATKAKIDECEELTEMASKSALVRKILSEFSNLCSYLEAYERSDRQEPSCFIFEGPPGTMKSIVMNQVLQALGESKYLHSTKPTTDGKDFWDAYDNQHDVVFDDMGQMGISQWRMFINLISCVKLPLDCAAVDKKDTKFFNSKRIFATTNNFSGLNGLVRSDGISDVRALWRRGYVFLFNVKRFGGRIEGNIEFKYFNTDKDRFERGFPDFITSDVPSIFHIGTNTPRVKYIKWICSIVKLFDAHKETQFASFDLSQKELEEIQFEDSAEQQGSTVSVPKSSSMDLVEYEAVDDVCDVNSEFLQWMEFGYRVGKKANWEQRFLDWIGTIGLAIKNFVFKLSRNIRKGIAQLGKEVLACYHSPELLKDYAPTIIGVVANVVWIGMLMMLNKLADRVAASVEVQGFANYAKEKSVKSENCSTIISQVSKSVFRIKSHWSNGGDCHVRALVSGHCLVLPGHATEQYGHLTVYKDFDSDHRLLDHVEYRRVYLNTKEDLSIVMINPSIMTPFKSMSKFFKKPDTQNQWLVNEESRIPVGSIAKTRFRKDPIVYDVSTRGTEKYQCEIGVDSMTTYSVEGKGLCGSLIVSQDNGIAGMHVAGQPGVMGVAINWREDTINDVRRILDEDKNNYLNFEISDKIIPNFSGIKVNAGYNTSVGSKSNLIPSPLYNVYSVDRVPADLTSCGKFTVKDMAKKSYEPVQDINVDELEFAKRAIDLIIPGFGDASEQDVIKGRDNVAGINMKSSNGFNCLKFKSDYIDKEEGICLPTFKKELDNFENDLDNGIVDPSLMLNVENLKDELRNREKAGKPRSFRVSTLHTQFLTKKYTMNMVSSIMHNRDFNQIMVGVNPYKEWDAMYKRLRQCSGVWAGDLSSWDGKMLPQVQTAVIRMMLVKYKGKHKKALETLLYSIPYNLDNMMDDTYLTTHSMPSGNFLTAIFNSIVNRMYTAMWYFRYKKNPSVHDFHTNVVDMVYGDDKLNGIISEDSNLNAISMKEFFKSIGMKMTTATKQEVLKPYEALSEVSFLKRVFEYNNKIGRVMCPLDKKTLRNTIMWLDSSKDKDVVLEGKLRSFIMEMYLHSDGQDEVDYIKDNCNKCGIKFPHLSEDYLFHLYTDGVDYFDNLYGNY
jgi:hypothetical protein